MIQVLYPAMLHEFSNLRVKQFCLIRNIPRIGDQNLSVLRTCVAMGIIIRVNNFSLKRQVQYILLYYKK